MNWLQQVYLVFSRSRQNLYHFTPLNNAYLILKSNTLESDIPYDEEFKFYHQRNKQKKSISFTRDAKEWYRKSGRLTASWYVIVRFSINQDKLRNNFKLQPFAWSDKNVQRPRSKNKSESEERVYKDIKNFDSYIEAISLPKTIQEYRIDFSNGEKKYYWEEIIEGKKKKIKKFKKAIEEHNLLNFGKRLLSEDEAMVNFSPMLENNDIFYMNYLLKNPKLDSESRKLAKTFIKERLKVIDKAFKSAGLKRK